MKFAFFVAKKFECNALSLIPQAHSSPQTFLPQKHLSLTSGSAGPHEVPLEVPVGDGDGDVPRLRQHGHATRARLETIVLRSCHGNSLDTMDSRLVFQ